MPVPGRWLAPRRQARSTPIVAVTVTWEIQELLRGKQNSEQFRYVSFLLFIPTVVFLALKKNQETDDVMPQSSEKVQSKRVWSHMCD